MSSNIDLEYIRTKAKDFNVRINNRGKDDEHFSGSINFSHIKLPFDRFLDETDLEYLNNFIRMRRNSNIQLYGKPYRLDSDGRPI